MKRDLGSDEAVISSYVRGKFTRISYGSRQLSGLLGVRGRVIRTFTPDLASAPVLSNHNAVMEAKTSCMNKHPVRRLCSFVLAHS